VSEADELRRGRGEQLDDGKIPVPNNVVIAFFTWIATAVISLVDLALHFPDKQRLVTAAKQMDSAGLSQQQLQEVANIAVVVTVVVSVVFALLYVFFAWKMRGGRNWARVVLTVFTLLQVVVAVGAGAGGWVALAISCLAVVAMFTPTSNAYFTAVASRRSGRGGPGAPDDR
jgi:magnesium-transporting ATPase (P-type)